MGSLRAYYEAPRLALYRFFDEYLAHFNERVSGYWLGREVAMLVRRPTVLSRDARGRLHRATGTCIEYRDGWGISAWHGVRVPAKVILAPDQLRGQDWSTASNVEVRRVIQERIGERFVGELEGKRIDASPRGTLYEVDLHDDPERVAPLPGSVVL